MCSCISVRPRVAVSTLPVAVVTTGMWSSSPGSPGHLAGVDEKRAGSHEQRQVAGAEQYDACDVVGPGRSAEGASEPGLEVALCAQGGLDAGCDGRRRGDSQHPD